MTGEYQIKEIVGPTIQGEGVHAGRSCIILRFAGCNLSCPWCDTDCSPAGSRQLSAAEIAAELVGLDRHRARLVLVTGGEPTLQWSPALATALGDAGFAIHMESNGTGRLAAPVAWLTVSPKPQFHPAGIGLLAPPELAPSECKVVVDDSVDEQSLLRYEQLYPDAVWSVQPCMGASYQRSLERALAIVERRPRWRLSLQLHRIIGVP